MDARGHARGAVLDDAALEAARGASASTVCGGQALSTYTGPSRQPALPARWWGESDCGPPSAHHRKPARRSTPVTMLSAPRAVSPEALAAARQPARSTRKGIARPRKCRNSPCTAVPFLIVGGAGIETCGIPDGSATAGGIDSGDERPHVIGVPGRHAQPDDVYQQFLGAAAHRSRNSVRCQSCDLIGKSFGNGLDGRWSAHGDYGPLTVVVYCGNRGVTDGSAR